MPGFEDVFSTLYTTFITGLPGVLYSIISAAITLLIGLIIGRIIGRIVREIIIRSKVDEWISEEDKLAFKFSHVADLIARWIIYLVFIKQSAIFLGVLAITTFVDSIISIIPSLVEGALVIIVGYTVALYLKDKIISSKTFYSDLVGKIVFFLIIYSSIALALPFVGIDPSLINNMLLVIIGSVGLGLAIAMGLGLKDVIAESARNYSKKFGRKRK